MRKLTINPEWSPARQHLVRTAQAARYDLKLLSGMLRRNPSYLLQYVQKRSPIVLPDDIRLELARILDVDESTLRDGPAKPGRGRIRFASPALSNWVMPDLRVLREGQPLDTTGAMTPQSPDDFALLNPPAGTPLSAIAVVLERQHGVLQRRNLLFCDPDDSGRIGDLVVATKDAELHIGILVPGPSTPSIMVEDGRQVPVDNCPIWRVLAVRTA